MNSNHINRVMSGCDKMISNCCILDKEKQQTENYWKILRLYDDAVSVRFSIRGLGWNKISNEWVCLGKVAIVGHYSSLNNDEYGIRIISDTAVILITDF